MLAQTSNWSSSPTKSYRFEYTFDAKNGRIELTVSHAGKVVARLEGKTVADRIESDPHDDIAKPGFFLVFGHPADSPGPEVPTHGWKYSDLLVVFE